MNIITPDWPAPKNIRALTTTRHVWGAGETTDAKERERLISQLQLPAAPVWLKQTHSTIALPAEPENLNREADASYTSHPNRICLVLTADCLPLLVCNRQGTKVAAIHAGWRGLAAGVIEETIHAMQENPRELMVWLGPAISQPKFEVGMDVYEAFVSRDPNAKHAFLAGAPQKWTASLYQLATQRLEKLNIQQIYGGKYCTYTQDDLFFSWRRDKSKINRLASLIWILPS